MSHVDPAGALAKMMQQLAASVAGAINVALPCKVISFSDGRTKVQPLIRTGTDQPAVIDGIPTIGHRLQIGDLPPKIYKPIIQQGDVVLVVFCDRAIRDALGGQVTAPSSPRTHALQDGVIVGVIG